MSKQEHARIEFIDSPKIDYLASIISKHPINSQVSTAAKACFTSLGGMYVYNNVKFIIIN